MTTREAFLQHVRQAVIEGNRAGAVPPLPERGGVGYQGGGPDLVERFCLEFRGAGGQPYLAADADEALEFIKAILQAHGARKIAVGYGGLLHEARIAEQLRREGYLVDGVEDMNDAGFRDGLFAADVGITNVDHLIAETGSVIVATTPTAPRSLSLLPPVHIALAHPRQILPDLFDLFDLFSPLTANDRKSAPPSCLTVITGPSKTGDIELKLVTGVHGPGEVHVILWPAADVMSNRS